MRPDPKAADPYAVLGVPPGASRAEVRSAYRRRALATHPDVAGTGATADMARLNRAHDELVGQQRAAPEMVASDHGSRAPHPEPRRRPEWASAYEPAWTDHWAAWNDLPRR